MINFATEKSMKNTKTYTELVRTVTQTQCVVFDLDATLCDHGTQEGFDRVDLFVPIVSVLEVAKLVKSHGYDVVIATARPSHCEGQTIQWLDEFFPEWNALYMKNRWVRALGSECKGDQLAAIDERWDVLFWVDDSPFNAEVVRDNGVTCLRPTHNDNFWKSYGNQ
jgi:hypothetical protein